MRQFVLQSTRRGISRLFWLQGFVLILVAFFVSFLGMKTGYSAFLGGLTCMLGCVYVARKLFKESGAGAAGKIIRALYVGEAVKFIVTLFFFSIAVKWLHVHMLPFLLGFIMVQSTFWFSPLLFK